MADTTKAAKAALKVHHLRPAPGADKSEDPRGSW